MINTTAIHVLKGCGVECAKENPSDLKVYEDKDFDLVLSLEKNFKIKQTKLRARSFLEYDIKDLEDKSEDEYNIVLNEINDILKEINLVQK